MQISPIQQNNTSFGMAVQASPKTLEFVKNNLTAKQAKKFAKIVEAQKNNPVNINLGITSYKSIYWATSGLSSIQHTLCANVGEENFYAKDYTPLFKHPMIKMMEMSSKEADEQNAIAKAIDSLGVKEQEKTRDIINYEYSITQNRINMIKYVSEQGSGYMKDLKAQDAFNGRTVDEFMSMGFINTGFTSQEKTWSKTQLLDDYAKDLGVIKER